MRECRLRTREHRLRSAARSAEIIDGDDVVKARRPGVRRAGDFARGPEIWGRLSG